METFKFDLGKFAPFDFKDLTIAELINGPYVFRFTCQGFGTSIYYAGHDDATWRKLLDDGKHTMHTAAMIDNLLHTFMYYESDLRSQIQAMSFAELNQKLKTGFKNICKDFQSSKKNSESFIDNPLD